MAKKVYIEGMTCGHCASRVKEALSEVCGVKSVRVNLKRKFAKIKLAHEVEDTDIKEAVEEAGYEATSVK